MPSVYAKCGRFEGVAQYPKGYLYAANYAHSLKEAFALAKRRYPNADDYEVVEHEADGLASNDIVHTQGD